MLASGKTGEGAYAHMRGSVIVQRDDHYRPTIATWVHDLYTFTGCLMDKTGEGGVFAGHYGICTCTCNWNYNEGSRLVGIRGHIDHRYEPHRLKPTPVVVISYSYKVQCLSDLMVIS